ncbi:MAG TPA: YidB family protein [Candidatus Sulfotelmatobacter sp.]|nr:YidB family protein [Candidatus Sulfotelmatobacter sp.]
MTALNLVIEELLRDMPSQPQTKPSTLGVLFSALFRGVPGGMNATGVGGLEGLFARFRAAGLGNVADSWASEAPDLPVTATQLQRVLGEEQIERLTAQLGMAPDEVLGQLAEFMPGVVGRLTKGGVPAPPNDPTLAPPG